MVNHNDNNKIDKKIDKKKDKKKLKREIRKYKEENEALRKYKEENEALRKVPTPNVDKTTKKKVIIKSLKQNVYFYIILFGCLYSFTKCNENNNKTSLTTMIYSIIFVSLYGYIVHLLSHHPKFSDNKVTKAYEKLDNIFTRNKYFDLTIRKIITFGESHDITHHDTSVNKTPKNIFIEFCNNAITQGLILFVTRYLFNLVDSKTIILWSFFYASVHNINYLFVKPATHMEHHDNKRSNYGMDIWDIIFETKHNWDTIETHNHAAINLVVLTAIICYFFNKYNLS